MKSKLISLGRVPLFLSLFLLMSFSASVAQPENSEPMTLANLAKELIRQDVQHWKVVMAQAIVESGWKFDSKMVRKANNFVGMRVPNNRPSSRIGEFSGYSKYGRWQDCVTDIKYWQQQNWEGGTDEEYLDFIASIWAESPVYKQHVQIVMRKLDRLTEQLKHQNKDHFNYQVISAYLSENS